MTTERNPKNTRQRILEAAFCEIHRNGFQGMRVDAVLNKTGLKKGALYHHFPSKKALGYAVLEELIENKINRDWIEPLKNFDNPLVAIITIYRQAGDLWPEEFFALGCPLNNLAQEMSPIDDGFRKRIHLFYIHWQNAIKQALTLGQSNGFVSKTVDTGEAAGFILAATEGAIGMSKNAQSRASYVNCGKALERYLDTLAVGTQ